MFHSHFHFVCDRHEEFKSSLHSRSYLSQSYSYSNYNLISNESKQKRITPCLVVPISFFFLRRLLLKSDIVWHQLDKTYNPLVFSLSLLDLVRQVSFFSKHNTQKKNHTGSSNYYSFFFILAGGWIEINRSTFYTVARIQHPSLVYWTPRFVFVPPDHHIFFSSLYEIP